MHWLVIDEEAVQMENANGCSSVWRIQHPKSGLTDGFSENSHPKIIK